VESGPSGKAKRVVAAECPKPIRELLQSLASNSPVAAYLRPASKQ
jgi:hypothetical protein